MEIISAKTATKMSLASQNQLYNRYKEMINKNLIILFNEGITKATNNGEYKATIVLNFNQKDYNLETLETVITDILKENEYKYITFSYSIEALVEVTFEWEK